MAGFRDRTLCVLMGLLISPVGQQSAWAGSAQAVSSSDLRQAIAAKVQAREADIQEIQTLLRHEQLQTRVGMLVDLNRVDRALPGLGDATLAQLAQSARPVNDRIRAGVEVPATMLGVAIAAAAAALVVAIAWDKGEDERGENLRRIEQLEAEIDDLETELDDLQPDDDGD